MFEQQPEPGGIAFALKLLGGLLVGAVLGIFIPVVVFMVVMSGTGRRAGFWVAEILDLALLALGGYFTYQNIGHSAFARGMLIGLSIAFLLNAICGAAMLVRR
jgi:hypothetical protein